MSRDRLEQRLRSDQTGDRIHEPGQFIDRLAAVQATRPVRARSTTQRRSVGLATAVVVVIATLAVLKPGPTGPGAATATPPPGEASPTLPGGQLDPAALQALLDDWSSANRGASGSLTVIDRTGLRITLGFGQRSVAGSPVAARVGEVSRTIVMMAALLLDGCARMTQPFCALPVELGSFSLDDPVGRWLPDATIADRTIRELLAGSSGVAPLAPTMADLAAQIEAQPAVDWTRDAALARALAAPPRFAAGERHEPVDTESVLLEDLIGRARGEDPLAWIDAAVLQHAGLAHTFVGPKVVNSLMPGHTDSGASIADLDPRLIALLGPAGGAASTSDDLATLAVAAWGTAFILPVGALQAMTDASGGHRLPLGAVGTCPCDASGRSVISSTGHAIGWGALAAYDLGARAAVGLIADRDLPQAAMDDLLQQLIAVLRG